MENPTLGYLTLILALGMACQWLAWRCRIPAILPLLLFGFAAGHWIARPGEFVHDDLLFPLVSLSVAIILFEGGLSLRLGELRDAGPTVIRLCTTGVLVSWVLITLFAWFVLDLHWRIASLIGAIMVVTGPTVIAPILRTVKPNRRVSSIVKWEGIVIDPIGATLALLVFEAISASTAAHAAAEIAINVGFTLVVGVGMGLAAGVLVTELIRRHAVPEFIQSVFMLVMVAVLFTLSDLLQHESGLLTVTVFGVYLANQNHFSTKRIHAFKENLRILLISTLFLVLSARITMDQLLDLGWKALAFPLALIFLIRPISVLASAVGTRLTAAERIFLGLFAPRGIVAAAVTTIFAIKLSDAGHGNDALQEVAHQAEELLPFAFVGIVGTVAFAGFFASPLARLLRITHPKGSGVLFVGADPWIVELAKSLQDEDLAVLLVDTNQENVSRARLRGLRSIRGNILSEQVAEELELTGIGNLAALTANDQVNSMAVYEFAPLFGRSNVFQLRQQIDESLERDKDPHHFRGRLPFSRQPTLDELRLALRHGYTLKKTELSEKFTVEDFWRTHGENSVLLFCVQTDGSLRFHCEDEPVKWSAGHKLIALVPPQDDANGDPNAGSRTADD